MNSWPSWRNHCGLSKPLPWMIHYFTLGYYQFDHLRFNNELTCSGQHIARPADAYLSALTNTFWLPLVAQALKLFFR